MHFFLTLSDVMVLNDIINEAATDPVPLSASAVSGGGSSSAKVGNFRSSIGSSHRSHAHRRESRKISMMYASAGEDDEGLQLKERIADACYRGVDIFCVWDCCACYVRLSEVVLPPFGNK